MLRKRKDLFGDAADPSITAWDRPLSYRTGRCARSTGHAADHGVRLTDPVMTCRCSSTMSFDARFCALRLL